jgi:hypothetical protein
MALVVAVERGQTGGTDEPGAGSAGDFNISGLKLNTKRIGSAMEGGFLAV